MHYKEIIIHFKMERIETLNEDIIKRKPFINVNKKIRGLYISTDGKIDKHEPKRKSRYVVSTREDFNFLLTGERNQKCFKESIGEDLKYFITIAITIRTKKI